MVDTMRAVVLESAPAPPEGLKIKKIPIPKAEKGKVLIKVKAYGLNRSGTCKQPRLLQTSRNNPDTTQLT